MRSRRPNQRDNTSRKAMIQQGFTHAANLVFFSTRLQADRLSPFSPPMTRKRPELPSSSIRLSHNEKQAITGDVVGSAHFEKVRLATFELDVVLVASPRRRESRRHRPTLGPQRVLDRGCELVKSMRNGLGRCRLVRGRRGLVTQRNSAHVRLGDKWASLAPNGFCGFRLAGFRPREAAASGDPLLDSADPAGAPSRALRR